MFPPVFEVADASAAVRAELDSGDAMRLWPFGKARQKETRPYAVWQVVYGNPSNSLSCIPSEDLYGCQIDTYAKTASESRKVAEVLRDAYEASFYPVVSYNGEDWEQATGLYRDSLTVEFWTERSS